MLYLQPGIYPQVDVRQENIDQAIRHYVVDYKIESTSNGGGRHVYFTLRNLPGLSADIIAGIAYDLFHELYRAGVNGSSNISLQVKLGLNFEHARPMGSIYTLKVPTACHASERHISHAYAFAGHEDIRPHLCFFFKEVTDEEALHTK